MIQGTVEKEHRMTKQEFLSELQQCLKGQVAESIIQENLRYYDQYIMEEARKGRSESEVLESLGSPRLIAKTIIDTNPGSGGYEYEQDYEQQSQSDEEQSFGNSKGFNANYTKENGWDVRIGKFRLNSWYGKLTILLVVLLIFFLVAQVFVFLAPVIAVVLVVCVVLNLITGRK